MREKSVRSVAAAALVVALTAAVAAGVFFMGPPSQARALRLDERRVQDLLTIARLVDLVYTRDSALLPSLEQIEASGVHGAVLRDPVSGAPYEYFVKGDNGSYELCATFARASPVEAAVNAWDAWIHPAGRHCFPRIAKSG